MKKLLDFTGGLVVSSRDGEKAHCGVGLCKVAPRHSLERTGVAAGQATITVRVGELSEHCAVTVLNSEVPVLKAGISSQVVYVGFTRQITAPAPCLSKGITPKLRIIFLSGLAVFFISAGYNFPFCSIITSISRLSLSR